MEARSRPELAKALVVTTIVLAALVGSAALHAWAGISDDGHAVWRPVGHGTVLVFFAWAATGLLGLAVLVVGRVRSIGAVAIMCALIGIYLLMSA